MPEAYLNVTNPEYASGTPEYLFSGLGEADSASLHCMIYERGEIFSQALTTFRGGFCTLVVWLATCILWWSKVQCSFSNGLGQYGQITLQTTWKSARHLKISACGGKPRPVFTLFLFLIPIFKIALLSCGGMLPCWYGVPFCAQSNLSVIIS